MAATDATTDIDSVTAANAPANGEAGPGSAGGSKKPKDSAFRQQRLPAWQPILTAGTVLPTFFVIGIAFIPIGIGMLWFSDNVKEVTVPYTRCKEDLTKNDCSEVVVNASTSCTCNETFTLDEDWKGEAFMYYALTNFYQNHRRYVKSRDDSQLLGEIDRAPSSDCDPFDKPPDNDDKKYIPCGAIANSLFSDEITLQYQPPLADDGSTQEPIDVPLIRTGIAWSSDKKYKFKNPTVPAGSSLETVFRNAGYVRPRDWHKDLWMLDTKHEDNNGLQNEDLIVWMRTAALPNFRKLYRKINHTDREEFKEGLPKGTYTLNIDYRFRVTQFSGTKSVVISTTSLLGGKNPFLGIAYITVGSICLLMGVVFLFVHIKCGKQTNEMMNITSRTPYS